jgi:hypothetical protein
MVGAAAALVLVIVGNYTHTPLDVAPANPQDSSHFVSGPREKPAESSPITRSLDSVRGYRPRVLIRTASAATIPHRGAFAPFGLVGPTDSKASVPKDLIDFAESRTVMSEPRTNRAVETPDSDRPLVTPSAVDSNPRISRVDFDPPASLPSVVEPIRVARAEERPLPPPVPEVIEMQASTVSARPTAYTMEAKGSIDPGSVASLAELKRTLQKDAEEESLPAGAFRMNDRRELRLSVHTSRF